MLKTRVIPCLLLKDWNIVKTIQYKTIRTVGNPIQHVKVFNVRNVDELVLLDIDAPRTNKTLQFETVRDISKECFMPLAVGGGIHSIADIRKALRAGADKIVINTHAFSSSGFVTNGARVFGKQCMVVSIDVKKSNGKYTVWTHAGTKNTNIDPIAWAIEVEKRGAGEILLTAIDQDGTMEGYDLNLIKSVTNRVSIPVIANGGAGKLSDFVSAVQVDAHAVAAASIFLYTQTTPANIKLYMKKHGIETRV